MLTKTFAIDITYNCKLRFRAETILVSITTRTLNPGTQDATHEIDGVRVYGYDGAKQRRMSSNFERACREQLMLSQIVWCTQCDEQRPHQPNVNTQRLHCIVCDNSR